MPFSVIDNPGNAVISRANFNPAFSGQIQCNGGVSNCLAAYFTQGAFVTSRPRLDGSPTSPIDPDPNACRFYGRCPNSADLCAKAMPPLRAVGPDAKPAELCEWLRRPHKGVLADYDFREPDLTGMKLTSFIYSKLVKGQYTRLPFRVEK